MNIKYFVGKTLNNILIKLIEKIPYSLSFIPNGRFAELDIIRSKEAISTIFDVGANIGQTALNYINIFPKAIVYSFEPVKESYDKLVQNLLSYPNVYAINTALGAEKRKLTISLNSDSQINSLKNIVINSGHITERITVDTGKSFCDQNKITYIDLLKIDTEGYELDVLQGFDKQFLMEHVKFIYCEVGFDTDDLYKTTFSDASSYVRDCGFITTGFYESSRWGKTKLKLGFCNVLFTNSNLVEIF